MRWSSSTRHALVAAVTCVGVLTGCTFDPNAGAPLDTQAGTNGPPTPEATTTSPRPEPPEATNADPQPAGDTPTPTAVPDPTAPGETVSSVVNAAIDTTSVDEQQAATDVLYAINARRQAAGLPPVSVDSCLRNQAVAWARNMARAQRASENPSRSCANGRGQHAAAGSFDSAEHLVEVWAGSEQGAALVDSAARTVGVAVVMVPAQDGPPTWYAVADFAGTTVPPHGPHYERNASDRPMTSRSRVAAGRPLVGRMTVSLPKVAAAIEWNVVAGRARDSARWTLTDQIAAGTASFPSAVSGEHEVEFDRFVASGSLDTAELAPGEYTLQVRYPGSDACNKYPIIVY